MSKSNSTPVTTATSASGGGPMKRDSGAALEITDLLPLPQPSSPRAKNRISVTSTLPFPLLEGEVEAASARWEVAHQELEESSSVQFSLRLTNFRIHVTCDSEVAVNLPVAAVEAFESDRDQLLLETKWGSSLRIPLAEGKTMEQDGDVSRDTQYQKQLSKIVKERLGQNKDGLLAEEENRQPPITSQVEVDFGGGEEQEEERASRSTHVRNRSENGISSSSSVREADTNDKCPIAPTATGFNIECHVDSSSEVLTQERLSALFKQIHDSHSKSLKQVVSENIREGGEDDPAARVFAFVHKEAFAKQENSDSANVKAIFSPVVESQIMDDWFNREIKRLGFDLQVAWRVSSLNQDFAHCSSYPERLLVPNNISDEILEKVCLFRSARRIPAVTWRHPVTGAALARSSQPEVGWLGWRSKEDESLIQAIAQSCAFEQGQKRLDEAAQNEKRRDPDQFNATDVEPKYVKTNGNQVTGVSESRPAADGAIKDLTSEASVLKQESKKVLLMDARSYAAAMGNRARGGGVECAEYYDNTEVVFMYLANIHGVRKSFQSLRSICASPEVPLTNSWLQQLDNTKWLHYIAALLKAAAHCATALEDEGRPVLVHCSDGWDRTPQIVSLAQLFLDPYYRTMEGFQTLIAKEWLDFGHKMADRCGSVFGCEDPNERSPVFLQWLDCVHQLMLQYPCHFEFNFRFLIKIVQHAYSQLFGEFLYNSLKERKQLKMRETTRSVWDFFARTKGQTEWLNHLYLPPTKKSLSSLWPRSEMKYLFLWTEVYCAPVIGKPKLLSTVGAKQEDHIEEDRSEMACYRVKEGSISREIGNICARYDSDGLTTHKDLTQDRLDEIFQNHEAEISRMREELEATRLHYVNCFHGSDENESTLNDTFGNRGVKQDFRESAERSGLEDGGISKSGQLSGSSNASSWETVNEKESLPTLWVPDHSTQACMRCDARFWLGRRKHHCRNCGCLVCGNCSEHVAPLPHEQLYDPVRICDTCHQRQMEEQKTTIVKM